MRKLFGTDGVRGRANQEPMTAMTMLKIAQAAGKEFCLTNRRHLVVIGKDTRLSGYMIEPALTAGFISVGMDVVLVGPLPTPAVAMLTKSLRADFGVMISASHNPYNDNGIKLFSPGGHKLSDEIEKRIENRMENLTEADLVEADLLGRAKRLDDAPGRYIEFVKSTFPANLSLNKGLKGLKIVIDCAHGAAYKIAPTILWELGAEIIPLGIHPDGCNINLDRGATSPSHLIEAVLKHNADIGIALDGDADRLVIVDEKGNLIEGDQILAMIALFWQQSGKLKGPHGKPGIVTTIMANLGLEQFLNKQGIDVIRTAVGDRYVTQAMRDYGYNLGGEPSGHIILSDYGTTGDGLVGALQVLALLIESNKLASEICHLFDPVPQISRNIALKNRKTVHLIELNPEIQAIQKNLTKNKCRLVVRPSGTEPLIRLMAEGENKGLLESTLLQVQDIIKKINI